jgi:cyanate lyase
VEEMNLREFLKTEGITQLDISDMLSIDPARTSLMLRGTIKIPEHHMEKLIMLLGLNADEILEMANTPKIKNPSGNLRIFKN